MISGNGATELSVTKLSCWFSDWCDDWCLLYIVISVHVNHMTWSIKSWLEKGKCVITIAFRWIQSIQFSSEDDIAQKHSVCISISSNF